MSNVINSNYATVNGMGKVINGDYCIVSGMNHVINGDHCTVSGMNHVINGDYCNVSGMGHTINGKYCNSNRSRSNRNRNSNNSTTITKTYSNNGVTITSTNVNDNIDVCGSLSINDEPNVNEVYNFGGNVHPSLLNWARQELSSPPKPEPEKKLINLIGIENGTDEVVPEDSESDGMACVICLANIRCVVVGCCGTKPWCVKCTKLCCIADGNTKKIGETKCPLCRGDVTSAIKPYDH